MKAWSAARTGSSCDGVSVGLWNSVWIVVPGVALSVLLGALNGYALAQWKFRGADAIMTALMLGAFVPYQVILYPVVKITSTIGPYNSLAGIIAIHVVFGLPVTTLKFRNFYVGIPQELVKAARIDGAGFFCIFFGIITSTLSVQLYSLRALGDFDRILDAVADAGYGYVETIGAHLDDPAATAEKLAAWGLKVSSTHASLAQLHERPERVAAACRTLGFTQIYMPSLPPERRDMPGQDWTALGRELGEMARRFEGERLGPRLPQPQLGVAAEGGRADRARPAVRGLGGHAAHLAGGCGLAGARRRRAEGADRALRRPRFRGAREGPRATGSGPGRRRLGRRGCGRARLARSVAGLQGRRGALDGGGARRAARPGGLRAPQPRLHRRLAGVTAVQETVIGVVGCGVISDAYLKGAARSKLLRVKSVADLRPEAARAKAAEYGVAAVTPDRLLTDPDIEVVINLTVPAAHVPVGLRVIEAGKHLYSEKPLATRHADGEALLRAAAARGVRVGCAPDTFLGAGHQACRRAVDEGRIGTPVAGAVCMATRGMEAWHPNPEFFFKHGGGPVHDMGPYYVTQLVNLLGPVARVTAEASKSYATRTVGSGPLQGSVIPVEVPTTVNGALLFASGANVAFTMSWDIWKHGRPFIEIYGTEGSLQNPNPNFFGGEPMLTERNLDWTPLEISAHPFGVPNRTTLLGQLVADYRIVGLLDMAAALREGRPHRASGALALHVLEVLDAFERASAEGRHVAVESRCERPEPLALGEGEEVFAR